MLRKENRLLKTKEFNLVFKKGRFISSQSFLLKYYPNFLAKSRFGFVVSTKVSKKAVVRNRIKRRLREITRKQLPCISAGYDIVIIVKKSATELTFNKMKEVISGMIAKIAK